MLGEKPLKKCSVAEKILTLPGATRYESTENKIVLRCYETRRCRSSGERPYPRSPLGGEPSGSRNASEKEPPA
ncbi:hypothetical protein D3OALGB2SA_5389 [Olavius algarvensis associated proteobacterium Delta 3]|nr:hypothetical protein D3OALGB2SA_5389 [Olavius algarvensis associated proteobacterium Delta 3]